MGFGGTGRTRTGDQQLFSRYTVIFAKALPSELLSHMAAGNPAGGLCLLSAEIRIERKKRQWLIAVEVGAGFEPTASCCAASVLPQAPTDHFEGGAGLPRYAPDPGIVRTSAAGRTRTSLCHGITALSQPIPRPLHRAAAYLRVPSVRLSSVTAFRFATAFSPCGGVVIRSRLRQLLSLQEGLFYLAHKRLPNAPDPTTVYLHRQRLPLRICALFCLGGGSGIPPAAGMTYHA